MRANRYGLLMANANRSMAALPSGAWRVSPRVSYASFQASISASAYRRGRHQQSRPAPSVCRPAACSFGKLFVGKALACRSINEAVQSRQGVVLNVPLVQTERKFVNVASEVLRTGVVIDANQTALHEL